MFKNQRQLKIFLSVLFVFIVGVFIARSFLSHRDGLPQTKEAPYPIVPAVSAPLSLEPKTSMSSVPRMAIILDDWGENFGLTRQAVEIGRPLTLSVLPHLRYSRKIAEEAHKNGLGVMLHMPMEPQKAREHMEPQTILTTTTDVDVLRYLDEALGSVPYAEGVNNHTGSKATTDVRVMRLVLGRLKESGLFFVDSFVIATTTGPSVAKEVGIPFSRRDVFIDNVVEVETIKAQLRKAIQKALANKTAIAIGHDKRPTLQAIAQMIPEIEKAGVKLVLAEDLVR